MNRLRFSFTTESGYQLMPEGWTEEMFAAWMNDMKHHPRCKRNRHHYFTKKAFRYWKKHCAKELIAEIKQEIDAEISSRIRGQMKYGVTLDEASFG